MALPSGKHTKFAIEFMAMEIVDLPSKNGEYGDFPSFFFVKVYRRVMFVGLKPILAPRGSSSMWLTLGEHATTFPARMV